MVSVIIAHFKNYSNLEKCLQSVSTQTYNPKEVIIINNCKGKLMEEDLTSKFPIVKFINPEQNLMYSPAQNLGIKKSQGRFLMFLNDDVILKDDFISQLVGCFKKSNDIGMVCGKILRMDGITIDTTGQFLGKNRKPIERGWQRKDYGQYDCLSYTFGPGGVAALYRRETLDEIALDGEFFDEDFGVFYEDLDLAWRANRFGWKSFYTPLALAYHQRGATTQTAKPQNKLLKKYYFSCMPSNLQFHLIKNRYSTMIKNEAIKAFLLNLFNILSYEFKLWGYILLFRRNLITSLVKNRGFLKDAWRKRKGIKKKLKEKFYEGISCRDSSLV